jgi:gamma-glutamyl-gamma-aminobutyraldehyde dehydrogenase
VWVNYWDGGDMTGAVRRYKQSGNGATSRCTLRQVHRDQATWINLED